MSLRDQLLEVKFKPQVKEVQIEGLPTLYVRRLSWGELQKMQYTNDPTLQVCAVLCDQNGKPVFGDDEADKLDSFPPDILKQILDAATEFNSLDAKVKAAKND